MAVEVGILLFSLILASIVIYLVWTSKFSQPNTEVKKTSSSDSKKNAKKPVKTSSKASKIKPAAPSKDSKSPYTHSWLLTTLKGHTGIITDLDISPNGKYLATSCEDQRLVNTPIEEMGNPSLLSGHILIESPKSMELDQLRGLLVDPSSGTRTPSETDSGCVLSRRQKKNKCKKTLAKKKKEKQKKNFETKEKNRIISPLLQHYACLQMTNSELYSILSQYVLVEDELLSLGYPVESTYYPGQVIIYRTPECNFNIYQHNVQTTNKPMEKATEKTISVYDSNLNSVPTAATGSLNPSLVKRCVRCKKEFFVTVDGEYLTQESCTYHWGQWKRISYDLHAYSCCHGKKNSTGCAFGKLHVWNGVSPGMNGPYSDFVHTTRWDDRKTPNYGIYALDCEMCYTGRGLEVCKVSVISIDGCLVYETLVKPDHTVIDYNTRFSGLNEKDLENTRKSLCDVRSDLLLLIHAESILIGHGLENDLRALSLLHSNVIDTAVLFPHHHGFPFRRSLKSLTAMYLQRDIQTGDGGHDSLEDAHACAELVLWKVASLL